MSIAADNRIAELEAWREKLEVEISALRAQIDDLLEAATKGQEARRERPR